jgi:hypothetical protein
VTRTAPPIRNPPRTPQDSPASTSIRR